MTNFVMNTGTKIVMCEGVTLKSINQASDIVLRDQKEIVKRIDDLTVAYVTHLINQEQFELGNKGDITALKAWIENLFEVAPDYAKSTVSFVKDILGFDMTVIAKDDDDASKGWECRMTLVDKRDLAKLREGFHDKLVRAMSEGICADREKYGKRKPAKRKPSAKGKGANGDAVTKTVGEVELETAGIPALLTEHQGEIPPEILDKVKQMLELYVDHPNKAQASDVIDGALNKYRNAIQAAAGKVAGQALKKAS